MGDSVGFDLRNVSAQWMKNSTAKSMDRFFLLLAWHCFHSFTPILHVTLIGFTNPTITCLCHPVYGFDLIERLFKNEINQKVPHLSEWS